MAFTFCNQIVTGKLLTGNLAPGGKLPTGNMGKSIDNHQTRLIDSGYRISHEGEAMTDFHTPSAAEWDAHLADTYTDPAEWEDRPECGHTDGWCGGVLGSACSRVVTPNPKYDTPHPDGEGAWEARYGLR